MTLATTSGGITVVYRFQITRLPNYPITRLPNAIISSTPVLFNAAPRGREEVLECQAALQPPITRLPDYPITRFRASPHARSDGRRPDGADLRLDRARNRR